MYGAYFISMSSMSCILEFHHRLLISSADIAVMRLIKSTAFVILVIAQLAATLSGSQHCHFPAVFNFGDSNSDTGGLSAAFGAAQSPNGETFFGKPSGRYCDGRLVIDFIAESVGIPHLNAYLDSIGVNFSHGVNFATAGSTILVQNTTLFQSGFSPFSLDVQLLQFSQFKSRSISLSNQGTIFSELMPKDGDIFKNALYTFDIGQNDITSGLFRNMSFDQVKQTIPYIIQRFVYLIKNVYSEGGRTFWIHNTGPVGCLPYILRRFPNPASDEVDRFGCLIPPNRLCQFFNFKLQDAFYRLREDLPLATFTYVDVFSIKYLLIGQSSSKKNTVSSFFDPLKACCGRSKKYGCGSKMKVNGTEILIGKSCKHPNKRVNWDGVHYTEAANRWVFDKISTGAFPNPPRFLDNSCKTSESLL